MVNVRGNKLATEMQLNFSKIKKKCNQTGPGNTGLKTT
jgi:hypothetical protein